MIRSQRARLRAVVALAADAIAPAWPLDTFVAVNPLLGFEALPFAQATARAAALLHARVLPDTVRPGAADDPDPIGERTGRWLAAYADRGEAPWPMPGRERGFFTAWKRLARHENALAPSARAYRAAVDALPARADDALLANLEALGIAPERWSAHLEAHLARAAGWTAYVKQRLDAGDAGIDAIALLAVRTWYERWYGGAPAAAPFDAGAHERALDALERRERAFAGALLHGLANERDDADGADPAAQIVFCIDVRSEPLRRALEAQGAYETFGFAGFFGVPFQFRPFDAPLATVQAPVLLRPANVVDERPTAERAAELRRASSRVRARRALALGALQHPLAAFAGVEFYGPLALLRAAWNTFAPQRAHRSEPSLDLSLDGFPPGERVLFAEAALRIMGLTRRFAPLVVLCGHGGATVNNAFATALDCGACGGNRGGINARVAAAIFNDPDVRRALGDRGIAIPDGTWFVAAEHDTTRDVVALDDRVPASHRAAADALATALGAAGARTRVVRAAGLPPAPLGAGDPLARAGDWAQPRPEWGLARNAAIVIGPRAKTAHVDLGGRCFLHSYDPAGDADGVALEQILTAPLIVAEWINLHYFFATVDPQRFGSGDKTLQQPVGGIGVVAGNGGDLRLGLPLQSTTIGAVPYHEPLRLLAVVYAPRARIDAIVARQNVLQRLFDHRWVSLIAIEPDGGTFRYDGARRWSAASSALDAVGLAASRS